MIFIILVALTLLILYGCYVLAGMLALSLLSTSILVIVLIGLLFATPFLWFRVEITQWRARRKSDKFAAHAAAVRKRLDDEYDRRNGITPKDRIQSDHEDALQKAFLEKVRRIEELERSRQR
jgi:hypothetical protein